MHRLYPTSVQLDQYELSRHASERFAVLTAVQERRARDRRSLRSWRLVKAVSQRLATPGWLWRRRFS
jgi:hypothetical protein